MDSDDWHGEARAGESSDNEGEDEEEEGVAANQLPLNMEMVTM